MKYRITVDVFMTWSMVASVLALVSCSGSDLWSGGLALLLIFHLHSALNTLAVNKSVKFSSSFLRDRWQKRDNATQQVRDRLTHHWAA